MLPQHQIWGLGMLDSTDIASNSGFPELEVYLLDLEILSESWGSGSGVSPVKSLKLSDIAVLRGQSVRFS